MKYRLSAILAALVTAMSGCAAETTTEPSDEMSGTDTSVTSQAESTVSEAAETVSKGDAPVSRPDMPQHLEQQPELLELAGDEFYRLASCRYPVYGNTEVCFYPMGEDFYDALLEELSKAEDFIFMEFFIAYEGVMLDGILDVLDEKLAEGVEVRMLLDGFRQTEESAEKLRARGIDCQLYYEPVRGSLQIRDHRKLVVIDGRTAFTGGINIGDEYINVTSPYGVWKDSAVLMRGDAVRSCTEIFFEQWDFGSELADCERYLDCCEPADAEGFVMPYADSPFDGLDTAYDICLGMIDSAQETLYITAPYLNIGTELFDAVCAAAERGAEVVMIVPSVNDQFYMTAIAKTFYRPLVEGGVKLYRYDPGFIHSKVICCDGRRATVGSVNLNNRSFYCDFECGAYMSDVECIADIEADFISTLDECTLLTLDELPELSAAEKAEAEFFLQFGDIM